MSSEPLTAEQIEELKKRHIRSFCMRRGHALGRLCPAGAAALPTA